MEQHVCARVYVCACINDFQQIVWHWFKASSFAVGFIPSGNEIFRFSNHEIMKIYLNQIACNMIFVEKRLNFAVAPILECQFLELEFNKSRGLMKSTATLA